MRGQNRGTRALRRLDSHHHLRIYRRRRAPICRGCGGPPASRRGRKPWRGAPRVQRAWDRRSPEQVSEQAPSRVPYPRKEREAPIRMSPRSRHRQARIPPPIRGSKPVPPRSSRVRVPRPLREPEGPVPGPFHGRRPWVLRIYRNWGNRHDRRTKRDRLPIQEQQHQTIPERLLWEPGPPVRGSRGLPPAPPSRNVP